MSLRWKVILYLSAVFALFIGLSNMIFQSAVMPGIARLERDGAMKELNTCVAAIKNDIDSLGIFLVTWSAWDDAYQFMKDENAAFIKSNLMKETFENERLNLIWFCRPDGSLACGQTMDTNGQPIDTKPFNPSEFGPDHPLVRFFGPKDSTGGVELTSRGPMLIAARPIVDSHNNGPIRGSLMMGRLLDDSEILRLSEQTRIRLHVWAAADPAQLEPNEMESLRLLQGGGTRLVEVSDQLFHAYTIINNIHGKPAILLRADIPRNMSALGRVIVRVAMYMIVMGAGVILAVLGWIVQRAVVRPLQKMSHHATLVGSRDNLTTRLNLSRRDEIGTLGREIDRMVSSLSESRMRLVDSAHRSGMLDVATDVLHNVGNAINTVNVTASVLERRLRDENYDGVSKAAKMIEQHYTKVKDTSNDEPGDDVAYYLNNLGELLESDRKQSLFDLSRLRKKVEHIHQIISTQLTHAATARFTQSEELAAVMQSVLLMNAETIRDRGIEVTTDIAGVSILPMNKVKFTQVMNNLVINAIQAIPSAGGRLHICASREGRSIRIEVTDNGSGIKAGDLPLLFKPGFTTRQQGLGRGLHYCKIAIEEAGGTIIAESDGAGHGAKFTIRLPAPVETPDMEASDAEVAL